MKEKVQTVIDHFEIPEDLAQELSNLLTKQMIRQNLLLQLINEPEKYEQMENSLVPIAAKIEAIKNKISGEFVPEEYKHRKYMWNYNGWEVDQNRVQVIEEI